MQLRRAEIANDTASTFREKDSTVDLFRRLQRIQAAYRDDNLSCLQVEEPEVIDLGGHIAVERQSDLLAELEYAVGLEKAGTHRRALDHLYGVVDNLFRSNRFAECDDLLRKAPIDRMNTHLLVGLLTITVRHRDRLEERGGLVVRVRARLQDLAPSRTERLLRGLE